MVDQIATRRPVLDGRAVGRSWVSVTPAAPAARVVLRAPADSVAAVSKGLGSALPASVRSSASKGTRMALCLGPDEWLVIDADGTDLPAAFAKVKAFHSAVEVSHRNVGIIVSGKGAQATLSAGCPQDLSLGEFPVGTCCRTIMGKAEVVLLRTAGDEFRVECWRSFADYVFTFLTEASRDPLI
jgi:sarcosine oxidase subunit gamma